MHDSVRLCSDRGQVLATYPAEKLAFSACCPDDRRFFGLVTMQATDEHNDRAISKGRDEEDGLRTSCHVFIVDPDLCHHQVLLQRLINVFCTGTVSTVLHSGPVHAGLMWELVWNFQRSKVRKGLWKCTSCNRIMPSSVQMKSK